MTTAFDEDAEHLGDEVYVEFDGHNVFLEQRGDYIIKLEPQVLAKLNEYAKRKRKEYAERSRRKDNAER